MKIMSLSLIIPVYNEENQVTNTIKNIIKLKKRINNLEIIFINDFSSDNTLLLIKKLITNKKYIKIYNNKKKGLGSAIEVGILNSKKNYACIFMADMSDDINDVIKYYKEINNNNLDAVLGSRFNSQSSVKDYPKFKFFLNRIFNNFVRLIYFSKYNDFTNAFKIYKLKTLKKLLPIVSENFNVFLELPLKIIGRKYKYKIIPINWKNRKVGKSNFKIKELSSMYIFTLLYCLLERILINKNLKNKEL